MLHGVNKIKFRKGKDAGRSLVKKALTDFVRHDTLVTPLKKAKVVKGIVDRLVGKAQGKTNADMRILLSMLNDKMLVHKMTHIIAPRMNGRVSGFVTMKRVGVRFGDGADMARLEWIIPPVEVKKPEKVKGEKKELKAPEKVEKKPVKKGEKKVAAKKK